MPKAMIKINNGGLQQYLMDAMQKTFKEIQADEMQKKKNQALIMPDPSKLKKPKTILKRRLDI